MSLTYAADSDIFLAIFLKLIPDFMRRLRTMRPASA